MSLTADGLKENSPCGGGLFQGQPEQGGFTSGADRLVGLFHLHLHAQFVGRKYAGI